MRRREHIERNGLYGASEAEGEQAGAEFALSWRASAAIVRLSWTLHSGRVGVVVVVVIVAAAVNATSTLVPICFHKTQTTDVFVVVVLSDESETLNDLPQRTKLFIEAAGGHKCVDSEG